MWNTLELWSGRMVGCYKQGLTAHPNKSLEDNSAENHENYGIPAPEVLRGTILASRIRTILVIFLAKDVAAFCLCLKTYKPF